MNSFTFVVFSFNQEEYVAETLESIKYQIQNYGTSISFDLIVIDDASIDNTVNIINNWCNHNCYLFNNIIKQFNLQNKGMVHNYNWALRSVNTEYFKLIAGDDIFSSSNLFSAYEGLSQNELRSYIFLFIKQGKLTFYKSRVRLYIYNKHHKKRRSFILRSFRKGCFFHTPSTLFSQSMHAKLLCEKYNKQFRNFEDDPSWYAMLSSEDDIKINFRSDSVIVLYRIHEKSQSNSSINNSAFRKELNKLIKIYYDDSRGMEKIFHWFRLHSFSNKLLSISNYLYKFRDFYVTLYIKLFCNKEYTHLISFLTNLVESEQVYHDDIHVKSLIFRKNKR